MIRKVIYFPSPTYAWLEEAAKKRGLTIGEFVRRLADQARENEEKEQKRSATGAVD